MIPIFVCVCVRIIDSHVKVKTTHCFNLFCGVNLDTNEQHSGVPPWIEDSGVLAVVQMSSSDSALCCLSGEGSPVAVVNCHRLTGKVQTLKTHDLCLVLFFLFLSRLTNFIVCSV
ncbi:hypothetical protein TNCT_415651 [Trichonephila clavata]|uniref:Uncharacterized protein n=1 Tax=Trichonephila clavata TaxID=2740835 RepID=A0A8X6GE73_TRICU|nr:hypothetical protein TNCT_415651 [Trichonephila clavata]